VRLRKVSVLLIKIIYKFNLLNHKMSEKTELELPLLDLNSSLNILIQGVQIAQKAGIYNFQDSASIYQAIYSIQTLAKRSEQKQAQAAAVQPKSI
jgi:hypothetical protein